ncbi:alpha/beta hydrolase [Candidatus Desantisbacteria bacterium CG_4_10_14_0_8_um_filter_48_22]|uniref:Alpha/beta hydrolase n=1 Tax=Candidatus Desantisbacteria bacterium CG_4_10_14_0_8_um_filter_48_22 TaxID=1974543 RepID=A0A2M7SB34_9BACT|nr:MAG: alpha/beta hydrolase [Candidatus Desantisbacteria bacterium CG_4_10_14_0_8_um_filter_48_22]
MASNAKSQFTFPVGYHKFHKNQLFNFQLNRWYSLGYARFEDMKEAGQKINNFNDWKNEMLKLADKAVSEDRLMNAAFYYRAAEFYTFPGDPDKELLYDKFIDLFYRVFQSGEIERFKIPYNEACLPVMKISSAGGKKGTIVMHGGFDSYIEEFYSWMRYFSDNGYEVIAFEGPGQGAALKKYGLGLDYEWEKPVKAVLDYFKLDDATLLGISMGGWFCFRAAAFEPRIKRVIASAIAFDYMKNMNVVLRGIHTWFFKYFRDFTNKMAIMKMEKGKGMGKWMMQNMMYITKKKIPMDAFEIWMQMNEKNLHSDLVRQDVLILTGRNDHFIPFRMHDMQVKALTNAKSVTARVFTKEEQAQNHCQIGNIGLALDVMVKWLEKIS